MKWGMPVSAALIVLAVAGQAAADPAVSNTNVKFTALLGEADVAGSSDTAWSGIAALTAPLGENWGVQLEAGGSGFGDDSGFGGAAHIFRRDPDKYLAGVFVAHSSFDDANLSATRFGAEGEMYFEKISLLASAGYQWSDDLGDTAFGGAEIRLYANDDLMLSAGAAALEDVAYGRFSAEWRLSPHALPGVALRAEAAAGDNDFTSVMGGVTVYFGENATLKDRHRKQDPESGMFDQYQDLLAQSGNIKPLPQVIQCISLCNQIN